MRQLQLDGAVVYDVGADIGIFSMFFARLVGAAGRVIAFEPVASNCAMLRRNLLANGIANVTLVPLALGAARERRAAFAMAAYSGRASVAAADGAAEPGYQPAGEFEIYPLDQLLVERELPRPDFIKIDVEGAECEVLAGASALLQVRHPGLFIELHGAGPASKAANAEQVCAILDELDYDVVHVETAARVRPGVFVPGTGHLLCTHGLARWTGAASPSRLRPNLPFRAA